MEEMSGAEVSKKSHIWRAYSVEHVCSAGWCGKKRKARRRIPQSSILGTNCICAWAIHKSFFSSTKKNRNAVPSSAVLMFTFYISAPNWWGNFENTSTPSLFLPSSIMSDSAWRPRHVSQSRSPSPTLHTLRNRSLEWQSTNAVQKWYMNE